MQTIHDSAQYFCRYVLDFPQINAFFCCFICNYLNCRSFATNDDMLKKERQAFILRQVNLHNKVLSVDLSQEMKVSEDTIRRDLNEMSQMNKLIKVHGGALSKSFHLSIPSNNVYALSGKKSIASKASRLVKDGMFVSYQRRYYDY